MATPEEKEKKFKSFFEGINKELLEDKALTKAAQEIGSHEELIQHLRTMLTDGKDAGSLHRHLCLTFTHYPNKFEGEEIKMVLDYWRGHAPEVLARKEGDGFIGIHSSAQAGEEAYLCSAMDIREVAKKEWGLWAPLDWVYRCSDPRELWIKLIEEE